MQGQRGRCLRAVDQGQALFGTQHQGRNTCGLQGPQRGNRRAVDQHKTFTHQRQRHVRQRRQVTRRTHRAFGRNPGHQPRVVNRDQRVNHHLAHAGISARQAGRLQRQHQTHHGGLQRFAHAYAVRADQVELQRGQLRLADALIGQFAKARVHTVDRRIAIRRVLHYLLTGADGRTAGVPQLQRHRISVDRHQLLQRQRAGGDGDSAAHLSGLSWAGSSPARGRIARLPRSPHRHGA